MKKTILFMTVILTLLCVAAAGQADVLCYACGEKMEVTVSEDLTSCSEVCINPECGRFDKPDTCDHTEFCKGKNCPYCGQPGTMEHSGWKLDLLKTYPCSAATCTAPASYYMICLYCGTPSNSEDLTVTADNKKDPNNHGSNTLTEVITGLEPDCAGGYYSLKQCGGCGKYVCTELGRTYDAIPENWVSGEGKRDPVPGKHPAATQADVVYPGLGPTCQPGYWALLKCSACGTFFCTELGKTYDSQPSLEEWKTMAPREPSDLWHRTDKVVDKVAATCSTPGNTEYRVCRLCGKNFDGGGSLAEGAEIIPAKHPDKVSFQPSVPGNCTAKAVAEHYYCSACDKYFLDSTCIGETTLENLTGKTDPTVHDYTKRDPVPDALYSAATCTAPAYYHMSCSRCGDICTSTDAKFLFASGEKDPGAHYGTQTAALAAREPTCIEPGRYAATRCNACLAWYNTEQDLYLKNGTETGWETLAVIGAKTHIYGEPVYTWNGDKCTAERTCTRPECAADADGHTESETVTGTFAEDTPANCTECAKGHYEAKAFTNAAFSAQQTAKDSAVNGSPPGHDYANHEAKAPTCTENGWDAYRACGRCDYTEYAEKPALGHAYEDHEAKAPTCTAVGWDAYRACGRCDYTEYVEKPALGHAYVNHEAKAPTCTENGWDAYRACSRCDYTEYAEKPALGHAYVNHEAKAPTCTDIGWDAYRTCGRCGYTEYAEKPVLGHAWADEYEEILPAECDAPGLEARPCKNCDLYDEGREIPAPGHDWSRKDGYCAVCGMPCDNIDQHGANVCPICGYRKPAAAAAVTVIKGKTEIAESISVSNVTVSLTPAELKNAGIFTAEELKSLNAQNTAVVYFTVTETQEAPETEELAERLGFEPLGALTVDLKLMKRIGDEAPVNVSETEPIPMTLTLKPEAIPEGTEKVLVLLPGAAEPAECEYDAETGEIRFTTGVYGVIIFVFL